MIGPDADELERGAKFVLKLGFESDHPGVIEDPLGVVRWRYETQPRRSAYSLANLFRKPDFVLGSPEGREVLRIRRVSRHPPTFAMQGKGLVLATLVRRSILRNKYVLQFKEGQAWTFRMPLFTTSFWGESAPGRRLWVEMGPSTLQWNVLFQPGGESVELLGGLAFIHRDWLCYS